MVEPSCRALGSVFKREPTEVNVISLLFFGAQTVP